MNKKIKLEAMWIISVLLILGVFAGLNIYTTGLPGFSIATKDTSSTTINSTNHIIGVKGVQWSWEFTKENSTGIHACTDSLTVHVNTTYTLVVSSAKGPEPDAVIHDLYIAQFDIQIYAVPGQNNSISFTPIHTGVFIFECVEYCGYQHYLMRGYLTVVK
jgi:heme/copper-type cytochrome/quinol oxidase subunit 2